MLYLTCRFYCVLDPLFFIARRPYRDPPQRHDLGRMDVPCENCGALHWMAERLSKSTNRSPKFGKCCAEGKVQLPLLEEPPEPLHTLLNSDTPSAVTFRQNLWKYNRAFSFTSLGVHEDHKVNKGNGPPVFRISGELHHKSGALTPPEGRLPRYAQLYVYEPRAALDARIQQNSDLDPSVMEALQQMLADNHQYVPVYRHAFEILQNYDVANDVEVRLRLEPGLDRRRYNLPTADEVAVILPGSSSTQPRDIVLRQRDGPLYRISDLHPAYCPLQYPLLFPRGENGWYPEMKLHETEKQRNGRLQDRRSRQQRRRERGVEIEDGGDDNSADRRLTLSRYASFRLHYRPHELSALLRGGRLLTRYAVDMFASMDQQRLSWIERNQSMFRLARYNNLEDAVMADPDNMDLNEIGQRVFLPSSYIGGPRNMGQCFQDSMAVARYYRKVDLFVTMTTNPNWEEIQRELLPGQTSYDRPDLVTRVFNLKKQALLDLICTQGIFGATVAYVYTIEFQKRGLPHIHLLIFLRDPYKLLTPEAVDSCIWARWPDPEKEPLLFETVKTCMVHGPCGAENPNAPCMVDKKCSKGYRKEFCERTTMDGHGYPRYYRPNDGRAFEVNGRMVDNQSIIPYSPYLSGYLNCHINVECAVGLASIKYAFKYVYKGPDRGALELQQKNEIKQWIDGRYVSAPDAIWRIFQFETHKIFPNIVRLQVHLENEHMVVFDPDENVDTLRQKGAIQMTTLTAYFEANRDPGPLGIEARKYTYQEFPQFFTYIKNDRKWQIRKAGFALGQMYFIKPTAGEVFYLRTLLSVTKGATSFADLRRVPGHPDPLPTFHAACLARGLLQDDGEWRVCLVEASEMHTGTRLRHLFVTLLLFGEPSQPDALWIEFRHHICDDLEHCIRAMGIDNPTPEAVYDYGLFLLDQILQDSGRSLAEWPSMPRSCENWNALTLNPLIAEQLNYDQEQLRNELAARLQQVNVDQRVAYDQVSASVDNSEGRLFFLNGPGGTGKTFVYNVICARLRSEGKIVLCASSSGISALLLRGGRTAHSMFKIPIDGLDDRSVCTIPKNSQRAELMRAAEAIIWDEIGAQHRHAVEAVDRTLRDLRGVDRPFGGMTVILGGDFLQTLPVVQKGSREDIVDATIQRSRLWDSIEILRLHENMRLDATTADAKQFAEWLLEVGNGTNTGDDGQVQLPDSMCTESIDSLIASIYPGIDSTPPPPPDYFLGRMILAPRNSDVRDINEQILELMSGESQQFISADELIHEKGADPEDADPVPVEYLREIQLSNFPPGELNLKVGCPVILLRNLAPSQGLCNGTRMIITRMRGRVLEARLIGGEHDGETVMIPRITLIPSLSADLTFRFKRIQFPVRLAFGLTINKAQGQSVRYVGIDARVPVFSHGQLYVALSRATCSHNIKVLLADNAVGSKTVNVVYDEVLL